METATIREIPSGSDAYPRLLEEIPGKPARIFLVGNSEIFKEPIVAIVGTRKATPEGIFLAKTIAREFSNRNIVVASGLALGIDAAAHEGALAGTSGKTIAVLANGAGEIYPRQHHNIGNKILERGGTIISEYPPRTPPLPHQFLERNRIISGISLATIVIEAPLQSGAIRTARDAMEQGREVFVFPGHATHPHYRGSHMLIRQGARLVSSFDDIIEDLSSLFSPQSSLPHMEDIKNNKEPVKEILQIISKFGGSATADEILEVSEKEPGDALSELAILTLEGTISEEGGRYRIRNK